MSEFCSDRCETVETTKTEENTMPTNTAPAAGSSDPTAWRDHDLRCFPRDLRSDKAVVVERYDGVRFVCMPGESACKASWVALHGENELQAATDVRRWRYATSTDTLHPCNDWIVTDAARAALGEPMILNSGGFVSPAQSVTGETISRRSAYGARVLTNLDQARVFAGDLLWKRFERTPPYSVVAKILSLPGLEQNDGTPGSIRPVKAEVFARKEGDKGRSFETSDPLSAQELGLYGMTVDGYESLADVLRAAYEQAAAGKGKERHANDLPFDKQPMQDLIRMHGLGFATGQASKKASEALGLPTPGRQVAELLGAINYLAGAVIAIKAKVAYGKVGKQEGGAE